ncbi:hypothetical protein CLOM_g17719 [Closterium sp. NIES-68]|nr:hypothetical protein CLOM_g17719 [Closterium sp. NIES-68]
MSGGEQQAAFDQLKLFLTTPPVLRIADPHRPFELITDASDLAVGAVLLQDFGEGLQPIAYESRKLNPAERNYPVHDKDQAGGLLTKIPGTNRIWVPAYRTLRELLIQEAHDSNFSGHYRHRQNCQITEPQLLLARFIDGRAAVRHLLRHVSTHEVVTTSTCGITAAARATQPTLATSDDGFVTSLPAGPSGNDAILVVVDRLTKMAHFAACKTTITAEQTAKLFLTNIVRLHGIPSAIISDRDTRFTSNFWTKTWQQYGTRLHLSTAYHPQSDGQTERTNQTMEQLLHTTCTDPLDISIDRSPGTWAYADAAKQGT